MAIDSDGFFAPNLATTSELRPNKKTSEASNGWQDVTLVSSQVQDSRNDCVKFAFLCTLLILVEINVNLLVGRCAL